jgi:hypothetical protein
MRTPRSRVTAAILVLPLAMGAVGLASSLSACAVETPSDSAMSSEANGARPGYGTPKRPNGYGDDGYDVDGYDVDGYE